MKSLNIFSKLCSPVVGSQSSDVGFDRRFTVGSPSFDRRSTMLKLVSVLAFLLTIGVGNTWAGTDFKTEKFENQDAESTYNATRTYSADDSNAGIAWFVEHGCVSSTNKLNDNYSMHMRAYYAKKSSSTTWNGNLPYLESQTDVKGLVSITFDAAVSNTYLHMDVMYSTNSGSTWNYMYQTSASSGTNASNITFSGTTKTSGTYYIPSAALSPTGDYRIKIAINSGSTHSNNPGSAGNYTFRVDDVKFTYTAYSVTYDGNGKTSGSVPTDATKYLSGATVTVKSNSGSLAKTGYTFSGWNTNASGTGSNYTAGSGTFTISDDITLYAKWEADVSCDANPTIGAASLNGSFSLSSVGVQCASAAAGEGCSLSEYGFVWGTSNTSGHPNKDDNVVTNAGAYAANYTNTLSSTFVAGNTYYYRGYAKNNGDNYGYSSVVQSFTPYTVNYNKNEESAGGSVPSQQVVNTGGTVTLAPASGNFTWTGHHITKWAVGSAGGTQYTPNTTSPTISANTTFYAIWAANTYAITLNANTGIGSSPASVNATYNAHALSSAITNPTKTDYIFEGWNTKADGSGLTVIGTDGELIADVSGYTDEDGNWTKDGTETLYAKWTEHTYTNYRTKCCDDLGAIDGEVTLTQGGNSVTISGWSDVANVGTYTVKLYKKNGASWDLVSGTTSGGSAGAQGTRTGITSGSKSVTYTGLEVESEYKFTVQAIAGSAAYCDGVETAVTEINDVDVSSTPFKFRYSIYIDNGSNSGWAHHYITPTGNTDEGSVDITLSGPVDNYQFKIGGGFSGWWGQKGESKYTTGGTQWTLDGSQNVKMQTWIGGTYTFTVDYSGTTNPKVTITYPSANQDAGNIVYWDASVVANWDHLHFRVGTDGNANAGSDCKTDLQKVPGTDNFYKVTTASFTGMRVWAIANNTGWTGSNTNGVYKTNTGDGYAVTLSSDYQDYVVGEDGVTLVPYGSGAMGSYSHDNNCRFYTVTKTDGMLTHNVSLNSPDHGTLLVTYTNTSGTTGQTVTEGNNADLAHRCILTITATPDDGYTCTSLTVNSSNFTSGNTHILSADAVVEATFTAQTSTVTLDNNDATSGSQQTVLATYDASMPLVTTADKTPAVVALSRTGYNFNGWWDATSDGKQYYSYTSSTIASANNWDKTGSQTLYAQWIAKQYTITLDREGGATGAESATATYDSGTLTGWSAPTKTGYTFGGYWSGDNGTGTLVISTTGVLQNSVTISADAWTDGSGHWVKDGGATVYAKWTANVYNITYKDQGDVAYSGNATAGVPTGAPTTHTYGASTDLVNGVQDGYRFDGWFDNSTCTGSAITSIGATDITADKTYYAKWTAIYAITWSVNGSALTGDALDGASTSVVSGGTISGVPSTAPADNTLNNCANKFMGWSTTNITKGSPVTDDDDIAALGLFTEASGYTTAISGATTFYAVFAEQEGGVTATSITSYEDGDYYLIQSFTDSESNTKYVSPTGAAATSVGIVDLTSDVSVSSGVLTLDLTSGSLTNAMVYTLSHESSTYYIYNASVEKYIGSNNSAALTIGKNGWLLLPEDANNKRYMFWRDESTDRCLLYQDTYSNSGTKTSSQIFKCYAKSLAGDISQQSGKECYGSGYFFLVPATGASYTNYVTQCADNQVRVTYDFNGGTGTACTEGVTTKSASYTVCSTEPEKDYYDFAGWNDGTDTYDASATYNLQANTNFTAQWTPTEYSITYNLNDGEQQVDPAPVTSYTYESSDITLPTAPTKGHSRFDGWFDNSGLTGSAVTTLAAGSNGDKKYWAKWTDRHTIVFDADGSETTIYRASDEALNASLAGQGSVPDAPDAPLTCSSKVFMGWTETEIYDFTNSAPADLMNTYTGTVSSDKHYYAVWATRSGSVGSYTYSKYSTTCCDAHVTLSSPSITGSGTVVFTPVGPAEASPDGTYATCRNNIALTATVTPASGYKCTALSFTGGNVEVSPTTGSTVPFESATDFSLSFAQNTNASLTTSATFSQIMVSSLSLRVQQTDQSDKTGNDLTMTCYPKEGQSGGSDPLSHSLKVLFNEVLPSNALVKTYTWSVRVKASGDADWTDVEFDDNVLNTNSIINSFNKKTGNLQIKATEGTAEIKITADDGSGVSAKVTITVANVEMSAISTTPTSVTLYSGTGSNSDQHKAQLTVGYTPVNTTYSGVPYGSGNSYSYVKTTDAARYITIQANANVTSQQTETVTLTTNGNAITAGGEALSTSVTVTVKPMPKATFIDLVHDLTDFTVGDDDLPASGIMTGVVSADKYSVTTTRPVPNHADVVQDGETCEKTRQHLVGWIDGEWSGWSYLDNADGTPPNKAAIEAAGSGVWIPVGSNIDLVAQDGHTYYAVWATIE